MKLAPITFLFLNGFTKVRNLRPLWKILHRSIHLFFLFFSLFFLMHVPLSYLIMIASKARVKDSQSKTVQMFKTLTIGTKRHGFGL